MTKKTIRRHGCRSRTALLRGAVFLLVLAVGAGALWLFSPGRAAAQRVRRAAELPIPDWIDPALLPVGGSRSGAPLADLTGIVIHYVGNPGTSAMNNRNYFAKEDTEVCSHFVVGLSGEIVQCVPLGERAVASNARNRDTIAIEVCHPDESGQFSAVTNAALVRLVSWLCRETGLSPETVIRHYDVSGKECPRYHVRCPEAWDALLDEIRAAL